MANPVSRWRSMAAHELPEEVVGEILDRLPIKSLFRFQVVCKPWLTLISNTQFMKSHLRRALTPTMLILEREVRGGLVEFLMGGQQMVQPERQLDPRVRHRSESDPPVRFQHIVMPKVFPFFGVVGCCNGIICLDDIDDRFVYLWNPLLNHYKKLPLPERSDLIGTWSSLPRVGFGYDPISNDYKVLRFLSKIENGNDSIVQLYSSNADSWREFTDPIIQSWGHSNQAHVVVNGVLYFCGGGYFDLHKEVFGRVSLPSFATENKSEILDFEGSAAVVFKCSGDEDEFTLCTLDTVSGTWTKIFNMIAGLRLNLYLGAGQFYGDLYGGPGYRSCNVIYDYEKKEACYYRLPVSKDDNDHHVLKYKESLVSLKGFEEVKKQSTGLVFAL